MFNRNDRNCHSLSPLCLILIPIKVTRSHKYAANMPARKDVPTRGRSATLHGSRHGANSKESGTLALQAMTPARMRRRPVGSKDTLTHSNPLIIKTQNPSHENLLDYGYRWGMPQRQNLFLRIYSSLKITLVYMRHGRETPSLLMM